MYKFYKDARRSALARRFRVFGKNFISGTVSRVFVKLLRFSVLGTPDCDMMISRRSIVLGFGFQIIAFVRFVRVLCNITQ